MWLESYYRIPERKMAGWLLKGYAVFFAVVFLLTFLVRSCGGLTDNWPLAVWHVLFVAVDFMCLSLTAFALFVLFIVPLWYYGKKGRVSGDESFWAGMKMVGLLLFVTAALYDPVFSTIDTVADRDAGSRIRHLANYQEVGDDGFRHFMIPRSATAIKIYADRGIGYCMYDMSCAVGMEGLMEFAKENGYLFERRERAPGFADSCVTRELEIDTANITNYLFSSVGLEGDTSEGSDRSWFGSALFAYDIANKRLVGSYWN